MNLGKLLAAGKSFFGGRGEVSYRADKRVYVPKFNVDQHLVESKAVEPKPVPAAGSQPTGDPARPIPTQARTSPVFAAQQPLRGSNWTVRLNPFRSHEPPEAAFVAAVQTELSLEAVRVLHNDLTDADVEVVPVKSRTVRVAESPRLLVSRSRESLEIFGERRLEAV